MSDLPTEPRFVRSSFDSTPNVSRFAHEAMATTFELFIRHEDKGYAQQAAGTAFKEVDRLEAELSRYIDNSDISALNNLPAGGSLLVDLDTFECLQLAAEIRRRTKGAFDVTIGPVLDCWRNEDKTPRVPSEEELSLARLRVGMNLLKLDEAEHTVQVLADNMRIDLGGIGKGYAVDRVAELLRNWSISSALISGGYSSVLALDAPDDAKGWPVTLSSPRQPERTLAWLHLRNCAVSGSGLRKGLHIIDPHTARPVEAKAAAWARAGDAGAADALSTAFMVMSPKQIEQYCSNHPDVSALLILDGDEKEQRKPRILHYGEFKTDEMLEQ